MIAEAAGFRVVLAEGCPAYMPFLDFFLNMDSINDSEMNCVVSPEGWIFYGNNPANTICTNFYCPRASFTSFEYSGADRSAPGAALRTEDGEDDDHQTHLTFRTIRDAMHLYRAILARSEIGEVCISYCWGELASADSDSVTISATRKKACGRPGPSGQQQQSSEPKPADGRGGEEERPTGSQFPSENSGCAAASADAAGTYLSTDIILGALSDTVQFVDVEKQVDLNQFTFHVTLPSASLEHSMKLVRKCFGDSVCSIAVEPHVRSPTISFHASDEIIMRNCTIPLDLAGSGDSSSGSRHNLSVPGLPCCRFFLHWRPCAVIQQFCRIAPLVSLYMHTDQSYPGFVKFASDSDPNAPFMYVVYAWHSEPENDEQNNSSSNNKKRARASC